LQFLPIISNGIISLIINIPVQSAQITLTAAQVLAAYATPQLLVAAPGAGMALMVSSSAQIVTTVGTSAFAGGGVGIVQYGTTAHGAGTDALSGTIPSAEITAATSQIYTLASIASGTVTTGITNLGLYFSNQTGAFTGGVGSTLSFAIKYWLLTATV